MPVFGSSKANNWSDLAGDEAGGMGEAWGGGPWRAGKGGDWGGAPESSVGATKVALFFFWGSLKNLTTGLIWLVTRVGGLGGRRGEVAHGGRARGEMGGGTREQCGSNKSCTGSPFCDLAGDEGGGMGEAWGGGPWREQCGSNKRSALVHFFRLP